MVYWAAYVLTFMLLVVYTGDIALALVAPIFLFFLFWPVVFELDVAVTIVKEVTPKR